MDRTIRRLVRERASHRCEYCQLNQAQAPFALFHIDHVIPRQHGGSNELSNLALACHHCNLHKGPNLTGIDPYTGQISVLFNPRQEYWYSHFVFQEATVVGLTTIGRTTVRVLAMNAPDRVQLRSGQ